MCHCADSKKDAEAFENTLIAIDGAINTLVMARIILEQRQGLRLKKQDSSAPAELGTENSRGCAHLDRIDVSTAGHHAEMCNDCGEMIQ
jgi:hypothetical protein